MKLLLPEISVNKGNICSDIQGSFAPYALNVNAHGPHCVRSIRLECQNKYFLVWTSSSVNKSIIFTIY